MNAKIQRMCSCLILVEKCTRMGFTQFKPTLFLLHLKDRDLASL